MTKEYEHRNRPLINVNKNDCEYPLEIRVATISGFQKMKSGNVADLSFPDSKSRRARVQSDGGDICPTIICNSNQLYVITVE